MEQTNRKAVNAKYYNIYMNTMANKAEIANNAPNIFMLNNTRGYGFSPKYFGMHYIGSSQKRKNDIRRKHNLKYYGHC